MRALIWPFVLASSAGCMGFTGGVIPETGRQLDSEPQDSGPADDTGPELPAWLGTGADGALALEGRLVLDTELREGREQPDAVRYGVSAIQDSTVVLSLPAVGFAAGDEAILINLRGESAAYETVGAWTFVTIAEVAGLEVQLEAAPEVILGAGSNDVLDGQVVVLQRVPQYTSVTLEDGASLTVSAWDRGGGGVLAFRAREGLTVRGGASIDASALGYGGGDTGAAGCDGYQGESIAGFGTGGSCGGRYNEDSGAYVANHGGGGCIITGGGGGYGGYGQTGEAWSSGYESASGGEPYGDEALDALHLGSGGGGIWNGSDGTEGPGGDGGGIVLLAASTITVEDGATISANGGDTHAWTTGTYTYGAGGGSGGSLWLKAQQLELAPSTISAQGGAGEDSYDRHGGDGGEGRVRLDCATCNGAAQGSEDATEALNEASTPDPGYSEAPS